MTTTSITPISSRSDSEKRMDATVRQRTNQIKSLQRGSVWVRLGRKWGMKPETAKDRIYGERGIYRMVAEANQEFLADGHGDRVAFLMATIDASLMGAVPPLEDAIHREQCSDAMEDRYQADFIRNSGSDELEHCIKTLAKNIHDSEVLLAAYIAEKQRRKDAGES